MSSAVAEGGRVEAGKTFYTCERASEGVGQGSVQSRVLQPCSFPKTHVLYFFFFKLGNHTARQVGGATVSEGVAAT